MQQLGGADLKNYKDKHDDEGMGSLLENKAMTCICFVFSAAFSAVFEPVFVFVFAVVFVFARRLSSFSLMACQANGSRLWVQRLMQSDGEIISGELSTNSYQLQISHFLRGNILGRKHILQRHNISTAAQEVSCTGEEIGL